MNKLEERITQIIKDEVNEIGRPDLFREPLVKFASVSDPRFDKIKEIVGPWHVHPNELLPGVKTVIAYYVPFTKQVAEAPKTTDLCAPLWAESYVIINRNFEVISKSVADYLKNEGFESACIQPTYNYDPDEMLANWSHRTMAVMAGLATFGANRLGMTEKGSCGRFCSLITTAELDLSEPYSGPTCGYLKDGSCGLCMKACPVNALDDVRDFKKKACQDNVNEYDRIQRRYYAIETLDTCGKCLAACPHAYIE